VPGNIEFLKKVSWFEDLDQKSLDAISNAAVEQKYQPGQEIIRQGDVGVGAFIIRSGKVDIVQEKGGKESKLATLGPGDVIGEMALLDEFPRSASSAGTSRASSRATRSSRSRCSRSSRAASVPPKECSRTAPPVTRNTNHEPPRIGSRPAERPPLLAVGYAGPLAVTRDPFGPAGRKRSSRSAAPLARSSLARATCSS